ncbi:hypothetical protein E2C01_066779 [Portunus trituberculatus]|uniref:Uncharacterized protein n=1 Tax=Portunus trituberculatus TaxID=210409 RepID=A0A5B7HJ30_PORTR|nr:hypothetical protein [Portunus trituberculatus]
MRVLGHMYTNSRHRFGQDLGNFWGEEALPALRPWTGPGCSDGTGLRLEPTRKSLPGVRKPYLHSDRGQDSNRCAWRPLGLDPNASRVPYHGGHYIVVFDPLITSLSLLQKWSAEGIGVLMSIKWSNGAQISVKIVKTVAINLRHLFGIYLNIYLFRTFVKENISFRYTK